jgi:hypothetical protein
MDNMSLTDIVSYEGNEMEYSFARGNVGVLTDVQGGQRNEFVIPLVESGGGGETSHVF